jgi:hypothetical protein
MEEKIIKIKTNKIKRNIYDMTLNEFLKFLKEEEGWVVGMGNGMVNWEN